MTVLPLELYFDGACEPSNPGGYMVWAWVLYMGGKMEFSDAGIIKPAPANTNNVAEYLALYYGLEQALCCREGDDKYPGLIIRGDSQLVCKQIANEWRVKHPRLQSAHAKCLELLTGKLAPYHVEWIPREKNSEADELGRALYLRATGKPMPGRGKKAMA